ncbi:MAG: redoxin domain-containing protein [Deltaproteobacteria bacterium]|nr:redoxin domain-containing protein [Deltaproteobacteria bacterium]MBW2398244.1 redoxin domain-containing protein [Deltaproteobacteria bacterium]MBW2665220.1 redoxin domain-containing protein [Deltaproteobacteria bacterium]
MISKGEAAPSFSGKLADGSVLRSDDYRDRHNLIVYFFPKDFTPG